MTPTDVSCDELGLDDATTAETLPHPRPFTCRFSAGADQVSRAVDHVSNVEFLRWIDRGAELHCDSWGFTRKRLLEDGVMWFVARHEIDYVAEALPGDELVLLTWVRDVRRVRSWRDTVIVRPADGAIVCRASTLWVLVDLATRRPIRVTEAMLQKLEPLHG
jgi:acyl-CoA thioester hydrolase